MPYANIRMIVMDLDDTLLNDAVEISLANQQAIKRAQAAGLTIVLASGRPSPAMTRYADLLDLQNGGFVISYNGAYVTDWSNRERLFESCLSKFECELLVDTAQTQGVQVQTYLDGTIVTERINPYTQLEATLTGMPIQIVDSLKSAVTGKVPKVLLMAEPDKIKAMQVELSHALSGRFMISISKPVFLEFTNCAADKSRGIDVLCAKLGIAKIDVMAIGDSYNDLTMLRDCGVGVAMGNAPDDIKMSANVITADCAANGVAEIIEAVLASQNTPQNV
ncbi:Cof-type HAD-IIB family hydrolase [Reinekea sp.]|jgi:Cof subfamily protein (haloacid dehalogenase superfamily)|uniref:Cof-type HAD-IIB family hydrolase n=1 Tax=Reinekea sp. TaxID=1970455 RepID=UPI002A7F3B65|nr:Cof-type HAD-IIB family hydrolase [Reinekea sp.]